MNEDSKMHFCFTCGFASGSETGKENAFVLRKSRFDLRALSVFSLKKSAFHLASVFCLRPFTAMRARIEFDDRQPDSNFQACVGMVFLAVKSGIAQACINVRIARGVLYQRLPENAIISRPARHARCQDQVRGGVAADGQFTPVALAAACFPYARLVMLAGMTFFKTCGINGSAGWLLKESHRYKPERAADRTRRENVLRGVARHDTTSNSGARV